MLKHSNILARYKVDAETVIFPAQPEPKRKNKTNGGTITNLLSRVKARAQITSQTSLNTSSSHFTAASPAAARVGRLCSKTFFTIFCILSRQPDNAQVHLHDVSPVHA